MVDNECIDSLILALQTAKRQGFSKTWVYNSQGGQDFVLVAYTDEVNKMGCRAPEDASSVQEARTAECVRAPGPRFFYCTEKPS